MIPGILAVPFTVALLAGTVAVGKVAECYEARQPGERCVLDPPSGNVERVPAHGTRDWPPQP